MNLKDLIDLNDKKTKKLITMTIYTALAFVLIYFIFRKRSTPLPVPQAPKVIKREDNRPRISISGSLITPDALKTISKIGRFSRLHLVFRVQNNEEENKIKEMLQEVTNLSQHRVLFCETEIGYKALLRQLNPVLHIEQSLTYATDMSAYLNAIAIVSDQECEQFYQIIEFQDCESMVVNILNDLH